MSCSFWIRRKKRAAILEKERQAEIRRQAYEAQKQAESVTKEEEPETKGGAKNGRRTVLIIESGLEWIQNNTTLEFDITNIEEIKALPSSVKLFLIKFLDVNDISAGVASESIESLSQSFDTSDKSAMIWQFAEELLYPYLKSRVRFITAEKRWKEQ